VSATVPVTVDLFCAWEVVAKKDKKIEQTKIAIVPDL
jgi:hypothetical protein